MSVEKKSLTVHLMCLTWLLEPRCPVPVPSLPALHGLRTAAQQASDRCVGRLDASLVPWLSATVKRWLRIWKQCSEEIGSINGDVAVFSSELLLVLDEVLLDFDRARAERARKGKALSLEGRRQYDALRELNECLSAYDADLARLIGPRAAAIAAEKAEIMAAAVD